MSVSCASAGNCAAGGYYSTNSGQRPLQEPFVVNEVKGRWGRAEKVPGMSKMNRGGAEIESVSCSSPGNCSAGGLYGPSGPLSWGLFVVNEVKGHWGKAEEVPGTAKLNNGNTAWLYSLSCPSPGDCAATGQYGVRGGSQAFVVNEVKRHWRKAEEIPGLARLNTTDGANAYSISCASAGNCAAAGSYTGGSLVQQAFVVNERRGVWGDAKPIPGLRALNTGQGGDGNVNAISCSSAADCAAGGTYLDKEGHVQAFLANERNGIWRRATEAPGTARLNAGGIAGVDAISCSRGGACRAGGTYSTRPRSGDTFYFEAFVVNYMPPRP